MDPIDLGWRTGWRRLDRALRSTQRKPADPRPLPTPSSAHIFDNYLVLSFAVAITLALAWPTPGAAAMGWKLPGDVHILESVNVMAVFFTSGLCLHVGDAKRALKCWPGVAWGMASTLGVTPLLGFAACLLPLDPPELSTGLVVLCAVPTTLGIGIALTSTARGNVALCTLLTVATNLVGVFFVPLWLRALLPANPAGLRPGGVNVVGLLARLSVTVLLPTVVGGAARAASPAVARFATRRKTAISLFSTTNLACVVWQSLSTARSALFAAPGSSVAIIVAASLAMQAIYYTLNLAAVVALRLPPKDAVAVAVAASQKSAPVAVAVVASVAASTPALGIMAVSAIIGQLTQVFTNQPVALLARKWTAREGGGRAVPSIAVAEPAAAGCAAHRRGRAACDQTLRRV